MDDIQLEEELAQTRLKRSTAKRLLPFLKPYKKAIISVLLLEFLWVACDNIGPFLIQQCMDHFIPEARTRMLLLACLVFVLALVGRWLLSLTEIRINMRAGTGFLNDLRKAIFNHVQSLSMSYFDKTKHGRIIARADRDVDNLEYPFVWGPIIVVSSGFSLITSSVVLLVYSWKLFLAVLWLVIPLVLASEIFRRKGMTAYRQVRETLTKVTAFLAENISGMRVIQAFCRETYNGARFRQLNEDHKVKTIQVSVVWNLFFPVIMFVLGLSVVITLLLGGRMVLSGQFTIGKLTAYIMYMTKIFGPIIEMSFLYNGMLSGASAAERIFLLLDTKPQVINRNRSKPMKDCRGDIAFHNVCFRYAPSGPLILKDIDFEMQAGQSIALVGATGAGKSSIVNLIARFYETSEGSVCIDGHPLSDFTIESLHSHMGIVQQDNFLFSDTVMENLKFGSPGMRDSEVVDLARSLGTHDMISKLSDGYNTKIRERGAGLSMGERQIICFTRAFAANPRILILDEATSAVDTRTEQILQDALAKLLKNRTSVVVAHRLSTIRHANQILVLEAGQIAERGSHPELVQQRGKYYQMYQEYIR